VTRLSLIVCTYERPSALDAVLWSLSEEPGGEFEVVVADDGSGQPTADVVEKWRSTFAGRLVHVWQPDEGFRLALIRNRGALAARGDFLLFLDGDCVPRRGFARAVERGIRAGWFLGSRRLMLSQALSERVLAERLPIQRWTLARWALRERSHVPSLHALTRRDRRRVGAAKHPDFVPAGGAFGFFLGVSRADFERVNGYDSRFEGWGYEDHDIALRLRRSGLRSGWAGPHSTLLHLFHANLKGQTDTAPSRALYDETEASGRVRAVVGFRELADAEVAAQRSA
jgi:glycosyltransferase involved in cell wall biosynthesis